LIIALLFAFLTSCKADHVITLNVDTTALSQANLATSCSFEVGPGTVVLDDSSLKNFMIEAGVHDRIKWQGIAAENRICIRRIEYKDGSIVFKNLIYSGSRKVRARTIREASEGEYEYILYFTVGRDKTEFHIDPKIMVK
jgi:hypothetical protein